LGYRAGFGSRSGGSHSGNPPGLLCQPLWHLVATATSTLRV